VLELAEGSSNTEMFWARFAWDGYGSTRAELFADSVYNGPNLNAALTKFGHWTIEIVKRAAEAAGFQLLPRRWVVERTFAWLNRNRRLAKDFEASIASARAWVYIASVQLVIRRLA